MSEIVTIVRSRPSRFTSALPMGISYGSSGTWPVARGFGVIQPSPMIPLWNI